MNATAVWLRVLDLHGLSPAEITAPVVAVRSATGDTFSKTELNGNVDRFGRLLGLNENQSETVALTSPDAYVVPPRYNDGNYTKVRMEAAADDPAAAVESVLVHEYAHVVQIETNFSLTEEERDDLQGTSRYMFADIREGAAEYVTDIYARRYQEGLDVSAERRAAYEQARPNAWKLSRAGFYYGYRHVATRVRSLQNLSVVYEIPPETDEQLIHGLTPDEEPPVPLSVRAGENWQHRGTVGELTLQVALTENLTESRAAEAAAGWGNDTVLQRGDDYAWVVRMDDAANASELEAALRNHVETLATTAEPIDRPADIAYRVVRVDEETLALVVGDSVFVETARISADDGAVNVSTGTG